MKENKNARVKVLVYGLVQGVFFRQSTKEEAEKLKLKGWVKNREDGGVEAIFEGEREKIEKMLEWMKKGPPLARVEKVNVFWEEFKGEFKNFEIKYD
jgi:acylphosphatase